MADDFRKMNTSPFDINDETNALCFLIRSKILETVNTAIPVVVNSVTRSLDGGGANYLSATPLICQTDPNGNAITQTEIPKLRWFRLQHGNCAVICDPEVGDVGLAVLCQADVSGLTGGTTPTPPQTDRVYDMSDGVYLGGLWGQTPTNFVKIEDGSITVTSTRSVTVNAPSGATINANTTINGNLTVNGTIGATQSITGGSVVLQTHTHGGTEPGSGSTGAPN